MDKHLIVINGLAMPEDATVIKFENGAVLACTSFSGKYKMTVFLYDPKKKAWVKILIRKDSKYAIMLSNRRKRMNYHKTDVQKYSAMMKHERRHKRASGSLEHVNTYTEYECSKVCLHDFQRPVIIKK